MWRMAIESDGIEHQEGVIAADTYVWSAASYPRIRLAMIRGDDFAGQPSIRASVCVKMSESDRWDECDLPCALILEMTRLLRFSRRELPLNV